MRNFTIYIVLLIFTLSCSRNSDNRNNEIINSQESIDVLTGSGMDGSQNDSLQVESKEIKVFIENSGSMLGYVNGRTKYKDVLNNLLVDLKFYYGEENINLYFINSSVIKTNLSEDVVSFANRLSPETMRVGNISNSNINQIYKIVIDSISENSINFLISDNIYSIKGENTVNLLNEQQALTKNAFLSAKSKDISTDLYQFASEFNGTYYDYNNKSIYLNTLRPYYLTVLAKQDNFESFNAKFDKKLQEYSGYKNHYLISSKYLDNIDYTILTRSFNNLKIVPSNRGGGFVKNVNISVSRRMNEPKYFAIAINFKNLSGLDQNILDPNSYKVTEGYKVKDIGKIEGDNVLFSSGKESINPTDLKKMGDKKFTHVILIETELNIFKYLELSLLRQKANWVERDSSTDDSNIINDQNEQAKTFGLTYLVNGISEAYKMANNNENYFLISLSLNSNSKSGGYTWYIVFGVLIIILIAYFVLKKIK